MKDPRLVSCFACGAVFKFSSVVADDVQPVELDGDVMYDGVPCRVCGGASTWSLIDVIRVKNIEAG